MFKKIICLFLAIVLCFGFTACGGSEEEVDIDSLTIQQRIEQSVLVRPNTNEDFRYNVYTYYVEITECLSTKSNIVIPDYIQDLPVLKIASTSFTDQTTITSLDISNNVIEIGDSAFAGCTELKEVKLPEAVEYLGDSAFKGCENLREIEIPGTIAELSGNVFSNCTRLVSVNFRPQKALSDEEATPIERYIGGGNFAGCEALKVVYIPEDIIEVDANAFPMSKDRFTEERIVICGKDESAAANYAAINLYDFRSESDFEKLSKEALSNQKKQIGEKVSSLNWEMTLSGYEAIDKDFRYKSNEIDYTETVGKNENILFIKFLLKNASGKSQHLNHLDFEIEVDGYLRKSSIYSQVEFLPSHLVPMRGEFEGGTINETYLAVRVPSSWKEIAIKYVGDISLESTAFILTNNNPIESQPDIGPGGVFPEIPTQPITEPNTVPITEPNSEQESTTNSTEITSTTTPNHPQTETPSSTSKKEELSTLPF